MVTYTLITGSKNISSWSLRGYLAMRASGAPFSEICIPLYTPETKAEILRHSPAGKVPALKISGGKKTITVWDSLAICETLAERHPEAKMWPEDADLRAMARSYAAEMHAGFAELRDKMAMNCLHAHPMPEMTPALNADIQRVFSAWQEALEISDGPFLFGGWSVADIMYAPVTFRFTGYGCPMPPEIAAYCRRVQARPEVQDWLKDCRKEDAAK